jgi:hypothetical protein
VSIKMSQCSKRAACLSTVNVCASRIGDFLLLAAAALWRRRVSPVSTAHSPKKELARGLGAKLETD